MLPKCSGEIGIPNSKYSLTLQFQKGGSRMKTSHQSPSSSNFSRRFYQFSSSGHNSVSYCSILCAGCHGFVLSVILPFSWRVAHLQASSSISQLPAYRILEGFPHFIVSLSLLNQIGSISIGATIKILVVLPCISPGSCHYTRILHRSFSWISPSLLLASAEITEWIHE